MRRVAFVVRHSEHFMQTSCYCLDWSITERLQEAGAIDEFLTESEEADEYTRSLPTRIWRSDSTSQYYYVSEALVELVKHVGPDMRPAVESMSRCIHAPVSIDELGLAMLPDSCYFASISPSRVQDLLREFQSLDLAALGAVHERTRPADVSQKWPDARDCFVGYLEQWRDALAFAANLKHGLIGGQG